MLRRKLNVSSGVAAGVILFIATILNIIIPDPGLTRIDVLLKTLSAPGGRDALVINSAVFIVGGLVLIVFFLVLFDSLRNCGPARVGGIFGVIGSSLATVIFGVQSFVFPRLGVLFSTATEPQKAFLLSLGTIAQGMILGGFAIFTLFIGLALVSFGVCMIQCGLGRKHGWAAIIMAIVLMLSLVPGLVFLYLTFFGIYVWFILVGLKLRKPRMPGDSG